MRILAGILVISGLALLSWMAFAQEDLVVAILSIALAALWLVSIALRAPSGVHTAGLLAAAFLCVLSVILGMPVFAALCCLSASLYAWDLVLVDLRLGAHPHTTTHSLSRTYSRRNLGLGLAGTALALLTRSIRVHLSFSSAFAVSCGCVLLFLLIHKRTRGLLGAATTGEENEADG